MKLLFFLFTFCIFGASVNADTLQPKNSIDHIRELVNLKKYELALEALEPLIEQKAPDAINLLGLMYDYGFGVPLDDERSFKLYSEAAALGSIAAKYNKAAMLEYGEGTSVNEQLAFQLYRETSDAGYAPGTYAVADAYYYGVGTDSNYEKAEVYYQKAVDEGVKVALIDLANLYHDWGMNSDAEKFISQALIQPDKTSFENFIEDPNDLYFNSLKRVMAIIYSSQDRMNEAIAILRELVQEDEVLFGELSEDLANDLQNLAIAECATGRAASGLLNLTRSIKIYDQIFDMKGWHHANALGNFGYCYSTNHQIDKAIEYTKSAIDAFEACCEESQIRRALYIGNLAEYYQDRDDFKNAASYFEDAYRIKIDLLGEDHTELVDLGINFALFEIANKNFAAALELASAHFPIFVEQYGLHSFTSEKNVRGVYSDEDVALVYFLARFLTATMPEHYSDAFHALQFSKAYTLGNELSIAAMLGAAANPLLASQLIQTKELNTNIAILSNNVAASLRDNEPQSVSNNRVKRLENLIQSKVKLETKLQSSFPRYSELVNPQPLSLSDTQDLLGLNEGLFTFVSDEETEATYAFMVTKDDARAYKVDLSETQIAEIVSTLRAGIDLSNSFGFGNLPNFDMDLSHDLYSKLFGPVEDILEGVKHLLVVPTGPLESLPLNLLVTEKPKMDPTASVFENYQAAAWLPKTYSLTRLPSVSSLRALRVFASEGQSQDPFIGFGDPVLDGPAGDLRGLTIEDVYQGGEANIAAVRNLPELPETSEELKRIAAYLGAPEDRVYLRERASEAVLKNTDLTNSRVVAFATHGLVGGEISGLAEPALVLSPPSEATNEDDGLLKASEVAQLKMNADMVLLSACNTASGDELGAEGLSGLARAFIYAGARSLLVSHWSVESTSAAELTTGMFDAINQDQELGRSEALQRSMIELMTNEDRPYYSHPAFWAPFSLIGDGQTAQLN